MNFYKTTAAFGVTACLLMATSAYGATSLPASDTFESTQGGWLGDVSLTESQTVTVPDPAGLPITTASGAISTTVLTVSGSATNSYENASSNPFVDMMVKVSVPDEALSDLATGAGGDAEGAKFAVAVDAVANKTTGQFKYWNGSQWTPLSTEEFEAGAWVRVTMKFDYGTAKTCTVALNGNTCDTYPLIDNTASTLASVQIKGDTAIDEVVVAQGSGSVPAFADNSAKPDGRVATKKWLTENDIPWSSASAILDSQYALGVAADATATTAATLPLSFVQDTTTGKATLSFPGLGAYGGAGTYVLQSKTTGGWSGDTVVAAGASGVTTTQVDLPSTLTYYRIVPTAPASGN